MTGCEDGRKAKSDVRRRGLKAKMALGEKCREAKCREAKSGMMRRGSKAKMACGEKRRKAKTAETRAKELKYIFWDFIYSYAFFFIRSDIR